MDLSAESCNGRTHMWDSKGGHTACGTDTMTAFPNISKYAQVVFLKHAIYWCSLNFWSWSLISFTPTKLVFLGQFSTVFYSYQGWFLRQILSVQCYSPCFHGDDFSICSQFWGEGSNLANLSFGPDFDADSLSPSGAASLPVFIIFFTGDNTVSLPLWFM